MARPLRIEFPGAIYHAMCRGNNRRAIFHDDSDRQQFTSRLEQTVDRFGWEMLSFVQMTNHTHLFLRTPRPNLSDGMQFLLSGYANGFQRRHGRIGHVFQGRFKALLVENDSYFWAVSRYIHLNPLRASPPLVRHLIDWRWSSYPGFVDCKRRLEWVSYDVVYRAWKSEFGGDPPTAYWKFVEQGIVNPPSNPFAAAVDGWILGSQSFVEKLKSKVGSKIELAETPQARKLLQVDMETLLAKVAGYYGLPEDVVVKRGSRHRSRAVFAWLARNHTPSTRAELAEFLGLTHPDSVSTLLTKARHQIGKPSPLGRDIAALSRSLRMRNDV